MKTKIWICIWVNLILLLWAIFVFRIAIRKTESNFENQIQEIKIDAENEINRLEKQINEIEIKCGCCIEAYEDEAPFFELSDYDRWYVECMVAGEAGGESLLGKMAVAQCILNAMIKNDYSPKEVRTNYKYSGWDENLESKNLDMYMEVQTAVWCVFDNGEKVTDNPILYFYAPKKAAGKWHETLEFDSEIGGHRFFYIESDLTADWYVNFKNNT